MRLSLATNFFLAIARNEIEFAVDGIKLNQPSIDSILESDALAEIADASDETASLERAKRLMQCIRSDAATLRRRLEALVSFGRLEPAGRQEIDGKAYRETYRVTGEAA